MITDDIVNVNSVTFCQHFYNFDKKNAKMLHFQRILMTGMCPSIKKKLWEHDFRRKREASCILRRQCRRKREASWLLRRQKTQTSRILRRNLRHIDKFIGQQKILPEKTGSFPYSPYPPTTEKRYIDETSQFLHSEILKLEQKTQYPSAIGG